MRNKNRLPVNCDGGRCFGLEQADFRKFGVMIHITQILLSLKFKQVSSKFLPRTGRNFMRDKRLLLITSTPFRTLTAMDHHILNVSCHASPAHYFTCTSFAPLYALMTLVNQIQHFSISFCKLAVTTSFSPRNTGLSTSWT